MSSQADDFDLDIRLYGGSSPAYGRAANIGRTLECPVPIVETVFSATCAATCAPTCNPHECVEPVHPTIFQNTCENTCAATCNPLECVQKLPPTIFGQTCEATCAPQQTCPSDTCDLGCETQTCADATCGCNTSETCNQVACEGGITFGKDCEDASGGDDTCDACSPGTGGQACATDNYCEPGG